MKDLFVIISALFFVFSVAFTILLWGSLYGYWNLLNSVIWGFNLFVNSRGYSK